MKPGDLIEVEIASSTRQAHGNGHARTDAARRGRAGRDRQPHRTDQSDGGRLRTSIAASSTAPFRRYRQLGSTFKPIVYTAAIDRGFTPVSTIIDAPVSYPAGQRPAVRAAELRPQVRGRDHAAARPRRFAQHSRDQDDGHARPGERAGLREALRIRGELPALSADRARRGRRDADRSDERLHGVSQSGRADEAVRRPEGPGPRRQPAGREPQRAGRRHPRRHGVRHDEPAARRRAARDRPRRPRA